MDLIPTQEFPHSKSSFFFPKPSKPSLMSPTSKAFKPGNKSIKFLNDFGLQEFQSSTVMSSRNSSLFQFNPDFFESSPKKRKRTTSMSLNKLMTKLKMGINTINGLPTSFQRNLIDQMNQLSEAKKDNNQLNSLNEYSNEELITVIFPAYPL